MRSTVDNTAEQPIRNTSLVWVPFSKGEAFVGWCVWVVCVIHFSDVRLCAKRIPLGRLSSIETEFGEVSVRRSHVSSITLQSADLMREGRKVPERKRKCASNTFPVLQVLANKLVEMVRLAILIGNES